MTTLSAPSPAPTPPPPSAQRSAYHSVFSQGSSSLAPSSPRIPSLMAGSREMPLPSQTYRQTVNSPPPRSSSSVAYVSRQGPPTPIQSPVHMLNIASRQASGQAAYSSSSQATQGPSHMASQQHPSSHQTYQQHVQTMVNGAHQQQQTPQHRSTLSLAGSGSGQYTISTPPPQTQVVRGSNLSSGQPLTLARSYTPPAVLHPNPTQTQPISNLAYAASGLSPAAGSVHSLHPRHTGPQTLAEPGAGPGPPVLPGHHRVYSQGSNTLPGSLTAQPPR